MKLYKKNSKIKSITIFILILLITLSLFSSAGFSVKSTSSNLKNTFYYSYDDFTELITKLQYLHPDIFMFYSIGKTYNGRDIWAVKISDNVTINENETEVLFMGGVHGDENLGYQTVIYSMNAIIENFSTIKVNLSFSNRIRNIVNNTEIFFIPMVNPDGVEESNRKNRRINDCILGDSLFCGVDINRNFGYKWEELDKNPLKYIYGGFPIPLKSTAKYPFLDFRSIINKGVYRGSAPFSENESYAIKRFVESHSIVIRIDYHNPGEKIIYPWSWTKDPTDDNSVFVSIAENISKINGYKVLQWSHWYNVIGSSGDWMYGEHNIFPFTIELSKSYFMNFFPNKIKALEICKTHLLVNLYVSERAQIL